MSGAEGQLKDSLGFRRSHGFGQAHKKSLGTSSKEKKNKQVNKQTKKKNRRGKNKRKPRTHRRSVVQGSQVRTRTPRPLLHTLALQHSHHLSLLQTRAHVPAREQITQSAARLLAHATRTRQTLCCGYFLLLSELAEVQALPRCLLSPCPPPHHPYGPPSPPAGADTPLCQNYPN